MKPTRTPFHLFWLPPILAILLIVQLVVAEPSQSFPSIKRGQNPTRNMPDLIAGNNTAGTAVYPEVGLTGTATLALAAGEGYPYAALIDPTGNFGYFGTYASPGARIVKLDLASYSRVGAITLDEGEAGYGIVSGAIDPAGTFAYWGTMRTGAASSRSQVVKVDLSTFARVDAMPLAVNETLGEPGAIVDSSGAYAYFGGQAPSGGILIRVNLTSFTRAGTITLAAGEDFPAAVVIDPSGAFAYWGTRTIPARVVKVDLTSFTRVGAITLNPGEDLIESAVISPSGAYGYFGTGIVPGGRVVKINLTSFTREDALTFGGAQDDIPTALINSSGTHAYFGDQITPGRVLALDLSNFTHAGTITLPDGVGSLRCSAMDPAGAFLYFGAQINPGTIVRVGLTQKSLVKATRFIMPEVGAITSARFYSHVAEGNVRLGIYDGDATTRTLLWQSASTVDDMNGGWIEIPISSGSPPALTLGAGTYYLAWQIDTPAAVPSFTPGQPGDGFSLTLAYGPFPYALALGTPTAWTTTAERWSGYVTYRFSPARAAVVGSRWARYN